MVSGPIAAVLGLAKKTNTLCVRASGPVKRLVLMDADARQNALREAHDRNGAHQGQTRTLSHLSKDYYWCTMTDDVKQWVCILLRSYF